MTNKTGCLFGQNPFGQKSALPLEEEVEGGQYFRIKTLGQGNKYFSHISF
jgi:hypothetical protein